MIWPDNATLEIIVEGCKYIDILSANLLPLDVRNGPQNDGIHMK